MGVIKRVVKPTTRRGKRALEAREPKLIENAKQCIFLRGLKGGDAVLNCVKDFTKLKKPHAVFFSRKQQEIRPFEAVNEVEGFARKYDSSLFGFASHNKKRPNNLILGRIFDQQVLDMIELGIEKYKGLDDFKNAKVAAGSKPCLLFSGEPFHTPSSDFARIKNLLVDFFHGEEVTNIRLEGLEHVLQFVAVDSKIFMRSYRVIMKKSGEKTPYVELEEIGPSADFVVRRTKLASADLFKAATRRPKELKIKKVKNISKDVFGSKLGRVHMPKQNLNQLPTRNMKGLRRTAAEQKVERAKRTKDRKDKKASVSRRGVSTKANNPNIQALGQRDPGSKAFASGTTNSALAKLNTSRPSMLLNLSE